MSSAHFSPIMIDGALVLPPVIVGMIDGVGDAQPLDAAHRSSGSTTARSSMPIRQVPTGW